MRKVNLRKHWSKFLVGIYFLIVLIFLLKNIKILINKPNVVNSSVPVFSVSDINRAVTKLKARTDVGFPNNVDLNGFQFGKAEPF